MTFVRTISLLGLIWLIQGCQCTATTRPGQFLHPSTFEEGGEVFPVAAGCTLDERNTDVGVPGLLDWVTVIGSPQFQRRYWFWPFTTISCEEKGYLRQLCLEKTLYPQELCHSFPPPMLLEVVEAAVAAGFPGFPEIRGFSDVDVVAKCTALRGDTREFCKAAMACVFTSPHHDWWPCFPTPRNDEGTDVDLSLDEGPERKERGRSPNQRNLEFIGKLVCIWTSDRSDSGGNSLESCLVMEKEKLWAVMRSAGYEVDDTNLTLHRLPGKTQLVNIPFPLTVDSAESTDVWSLIAPTCDGNDVASTERRSLLGSSSAMRTRDRPTEQARTSLRYSYFWPQTATWHRTLLSIRTRVKPPAHRLPEYQQAITPWEIRENGLYSKGLLTWRRD